MWRGVTVCSATEFDRYIWQMVAWYQWTWERSEYQRTCQWCTMSPFGGGYRFRSEWTSQRIQPIKMGSLLATAICLVRGHIYKYLELYWTLDKYWQNWLKWIEMYLSLISDICSWSQLDDEDLTTYSNAWFWVLRQTNIWKEKPTIIAGKRRPLK